MSSFLEQPQRLSERADYPSGRSPPVAAAFPRVVKTILLFSFLVGWCGLAAGTDFNASWEYQLRGGDEVETEDRVLQKYNLNTGFSLEPTDAITTGAYLSYSRYHVTDLGTNETITPSANFELSNDIFIAAWDGTYSQTKYPRSAAGTLDTYNWEASLSSGWQEPLWPTLKLYYDQSGSNNDDQDIDTSENVYGVDLNWITPVSSFFYGFSERHSEDYANLNEVDSTTHNARLETGGVFFNRRLNVKLIQHFNYTSEEVTIGDGGALELNLSLLRFAAVDNNPNNINIIPFPVYTGGGVTVPEFSTGHLGVQDIFDQDGEQQVNLLRIRVDLNTDTAIRLNDVDVAMVPVHETQRR